MATALRRLRSAARTECGQILIVTGEPGIGKSALAHAISVEAATLRFRVGTASADAVGHLSPGAPLLLALRDGTRPLLDGAELTDLVTQVDEPLLLLEAISQGLEAVARQGPVLLLLDDLERADQLTRFLLRALPFRLACLPIVWLLVGRPEPDNVQSDLSRFRGSRSRQIAVERLDLPPLSPEAVLDIARDRLGTPLPDTVAGLLARAEGNPFLVARIVEGLADERARSGGNGATPAAGLPTQVARALHRTIADLSPRVVDAIRVLAVLGESATSDDVQQLLGATPVQTASVLDAAIAADVLDWRDGRIAFRHRLLPEAVYADLPALERRALHRRCARHLAATGAETSRIADHARNGIAPGETACAAIVVACATDLAAAMPRTAGDLALTAFEALRPTDAEYLRLGEQCVRVLSLVQRCDDAVAVGDLVLAHLDDADSVGRLELALARALWLAGRWEFSSARCAAALAKQDLSQPIRARLSALQALVESRLQGAAAMRPRAEAALAEARRLDDHDAHVIALHALAEISRNGADHTASLRYFRQLRAENQPVFFAQEIMALQHLDRYHDAGTLLKQAWTESAGHPASVLPALLYAQIWQDYNLGRLDEAEAGARTLLTLSRELSSRMCELEAASIVALVALCRGRLANAQRELALDGDGPTAADEAHAPPLLLTRAWITAEEGSPAAAVQALSPLVAQAHTQRDPWCWKPGWLPLLARIGSDADDTGFVKQVQGLAELGTARNPGVASFAGIAAHIQGLALHDTALLHRAVSILAGGPRPLLLAAAREDLGSHVLGESGLSEDQRAAGVAALDLAWDAYQRAGMTAAMLRIQHLLRKAGTRRARWIGTEPGPTAGWAALTDTERTVARLIGAGQSNKQVAARLGVSTNTVGTHARAIYAKLDVRSRAQLSNDYHEQIGVV